MKITATDLRRMMKQDALAFSKYREAWAENKERDRRKELEGYLAEFEPTISEKEWLLAEDIASRERWMKIEFHKHAGIG